MWWTFAHSWITHLRYHGNVLVLRLHFLRRSNAGMPGPLFADIRKAAAGGTGHERSVKRRRARIIRPSVANQSGGKRPRLADMAPTVWSTYVGKRIETTISSWTNAVHCSRSIHPSYTWNDTLRRYNYPGFILSILKFIAFDSKHNNIIITRIWFKNAMTHRPILQ